VATLAEQAKATAASSAVVAAMRANGGAVVVAAAVVAASAFLLIASPAAGPSASSQIGAAAGSASQWLAATGASSAILPASFATDLPLRRVGISATWGQGTIDYSVRMRPAGVSARIIPCDYDDSPDFLPATARGLPALRPVAAGRWNTGLRLHPVPVLAMPSGMLPIGLQARDGSAASALAYHAAGRANAVYIGYGLGGLSAALGESVDIVPAAHSLIGGRTLIADDGRPRLFASQRLIDLWLQQSRDELALLAGAHILLAQGPRDTLLADAIEAAKLRTVGLSRAAWRELDADKRAALVAELDYLMGLACQ
jgi:hypothetical protein